MLNGRKTGELNIVVCQLRSCEETMGIELSNYHI